jgi:hypothetical protein
MALDPAVADGDGRVEIVHPGVRTAARPVTALGVAVDGRAASRAGSSCARARRRPLQIPRVRRRAGAGAARHRPLEVPVPASAATILDDGCLRVTSFHGGPNVRIARQGARPPFRGTVRRAPPRAGGECSSSGRSSRVGDVGRRASRTAACGPPGDARGRRRVGEGRCAQLPRPGPGRPLAEADHAHSDRVQSVRWAP